MMLCSFGATISHLGLLGWLQSSASVRRSRTCDRHVRGFMLRGQADLLAITIGVSSCAHPIDGSDLPGARVDVRPTTQISQHHFLYDAGAVVSGSLIVCDLEVQNTSTETVSLMEPKASCGCASVALTPRVLPPTASARLLIQLDTSNKVGPLSEKIYLIQQAGSLDVEAIVEIRGIVGELARLYCEPSIVDYTVGDAKAAGRQVSTVHLLMLNGGRAPNMHWKFAGSAPDGWEIAVTDLHSTIMDAVYTYYEAAVLMRDSLSQEASPTEASVLFEATEEATGRSLATTTLLIKHKSTSTVEIYPSSVFFGLNADKAVQHRSVTIKAPLDAFPRQALDDAKVWASTDALRCTLQPRGLNGQELILQMEGVFPWSEAFIQEYVTLEVAGQRTVIPVFGRCSQMR